MIKIFWKIKILLLVVLSFVMLNWISFAEKDLWTLIPEWGKTAPDIAPWWVSATFAGWNNAWDAFSSWVFSWDSVFDFFRYVAKTLSQIWLVVWAAMIVYAGYKYATWVFTWDATKWWQDAVKWAIYWVLIIIFSYAIMRLLISTFL